MRQYRDKLMETQAVDSQANTATNLCSVGWAWAEHLSKVDMFLVAHTSCATARKVNKYAWYIGCSACCMGHVTERLSGLAASLRGDEERKDKDMGRSESS